MWIETASGQLINMAHVYRLLIKATEEDWRIIAETAPRLSNWNSTTSYATDAVVQIFDTKEEAVKRLKEISHHFGNSLISNKTVKWEFD